MKIRRRWLALGSLSLGLAVLVAFLEPNRIVPGFLAGEPFYRGRPVRYWREVLRSHGRAGSIPKSPSKEFYGDQAMPVLRECARDGDPLVRWPAISHLGGTSVRSAEALRILVEALQDESVE